MRYEEAVERIAKDTGLSYKVVDRTYMSFWKWAKEYISNLPLKEQLAEDDFDKLQTNINIPSLGKLNCTYDRMLKVKKKYNYKNTLNNEDKENKTSV